MAAVAVGAVIAIGGTIIDIAGKNAAAEAQAQQARLSAKFKDEQANEILARLEINKEAVTEESDALKVFGISKRGTAGVSSNAEITALGDADVALRTRILALTREAEFTARTLRQEANAQRRLGVEVGNAAALSNTGTILSTGAGLAASGASLAKGSNKKLGGGSLRSGQSFQAPASNSTINPGSLA